MVYLKLCPDERVLSMVTLLTLLSVLTYLSVDETRVTDDEAMSP